MSGGEKVSLLKKESYNVPEPTQSQQHEQEEESHCGFFQCQHQGHWRAACATLLLLAGLAIFVAGYVNDWEDRSASYIILLVVSFGYLGEALSSDTFHRVLPS